MDKNIVEPDQLASDEASWSGSTLFLKSGYKILKKHCVQSAY